jgi:hypothetical protein
MTGYEIVAFVGAVYFAAAVILGVCAVASRMDEVARRRDGGA